MRSAKKGGGNKSVRISGFCGDMVGEMPAVDVSLADLAQIRAAASANEDGDI